MMKRIFFLLLVSFFAINAFSQLSNKHWIPPLYANETMSTNLVKDHYIYLSTPEPTPFPVTIKAGNGVPINGSPFTISQGNPVRIKIGDDQPSLMMLDISQVGSVVANRGLILEGQYDFYVSFRVRADNHAEILASKGRTGAGTVFRLGSLPQTSGGSIRNFVTSFMATEDNTTVVLSDYDVGVSFILGNTTFSAPSQTFVLNKGESVVVSGDVSTSVNRVGFIGALLTSDKPIVVNTGNLTGGMLSDSAGQDFNLDQIVPLEQVGKEYIVMKGNGSDSTEHPLIIAHEDNTEIRLNGSPTPVATIDAGEYYLVPTSYFLGSASNFNMLIQTSKPSFVYQIIGGSLSDATSGFFFIPPLSCFWQKSVDLIPDVDRIGNTAYTGGILVATESFVNGDPSNPTVVTINGVPVSANSVAVTGNPNWKTYRIDNLTGDTEVSSTGALAVGVFGASGAAGYGGYFSGFGSVPSNRTMDVCSGTTIDLFDEIPGNPETNGTWDYNGTPRADGLFDPTIDLPGDYSYHFSKTCDGITRFYDITITVNSIVPGPSAGVSSAQNLCQVNESIDLTSFLGANITSGGTWTYNGTPRNPDNGDFNPTIDLPGQYTYTVSDVNGICDPVSATVTVDIVSSPDALTVTSYEICDTDDDGDDTNGYATFLLDTKNAEIIGNQTDILSVQFYETMIDAENNMPPLSNSYYSNSKTIYFRITNNNGCYEIGTLDLEVNPLPVSVSEITLKQCDTDTDAITNFNLIQANSQISTDSDVVFTYHNSLSGAEGQTDYVADDTNYTAANGSEVWVRIENDYGCYRTAKVNLIVSATTVAQSFSFPLEECDDYLDANDPDDDGIDYFDLTQIEATLISQFPSNQSYTFSYYENETDALIEQNSIQDITNFRNTVPDYQEIWVRMESNLYECAALGPFLKLIVNPLPDTDLGDNFFLCVDPQTGSGSQVIDATPATSGNYSYQWSSDIVGLDLTNEVGSQYVVTEEGTYTVIVTNLDTSCSYTDQITTTYSSEPVSFTAEVITPPFSAGTATIVGAAEGGYGIYEYSIDLVNWQTNPTFTDLPNGNYTIYVKDIQGCGELLSVSNLNAITYPNYFTPNGDGYNDTWNIKGLSEYDAKIYIFDRYGKLIKQISTNGEGWDGTYNGQPLPSTDYWFRVDYVVNGTSQEFKAHFSLKR
ncbi:T9SS type B sorting domain-containing protein [Flavobacterium sp. NRK F10]|uniref:T9SS type B sorting domain-containing protein n=1 Tax=Flavobacterium sp. NRK F10 TaxID=2954931 RepID=UPI00209017A0|nr:T9SS type B sorting domain-containing protein [Flavobacterium sp. NRK F10]